MARSKLRNREIFIKESKKVHKDKFSYDSLDLSSYPTIKGLVCREHGTFNCHVNNHIKGKGGCKKCQYKSLSEQFETKQEDVIAELKEGKTLLSFISKNDVTVMCPRHGEYNTNFECIKRKDQGCESCYQLRRNKESYEKLCLPLMSNYSGTFVPSEDFSEVTYICDIHNNTETRDRRSAIHGLNKGFSFCIECNKERKRKAHSMGAEEFIRRSEKRYGNKFEYDLVEYINSQTQVKLICKEHGEFLTYPTNHIRGITGGCPQCEKEHGSTTLKCVTKALRGDYEGQDTYFYIVKFTNEEEEFLKVGLARRGLSQRYHKNNTKDYRVTKLVEQKMPEFKAVMLENYVLEVCEKYKPSKKFGGYTECFKNFPNGVFNIIEKYIHKSKRECKLNKYAKILGHHFEGCRLEAYLDGGGVATIGWGNTYYSDGEKVQLGDRVTQACADQEFERDMEQFTKQVRKLVEVSLRDFQEGAIIDLAYNIGINNFKNSTLLELLNKRDFEGAAKEFRWWRKDNGKIVKGLVRRRLSEENLFRGNTTDFIIEKLPNDWREIYYGGK